MTTEDDPSSQAPSNPISSIPVKSSTSPPRLSTPLPEEADTEEPHEQVYKSRYRFRPTICVEVDEEDELWRVEMRGWKVGVKVVEAFLWNCGLEEPHFSLILSTILSSNVRTLSIDQNPLIPDHLYAYLITKNPSSKQRPNLVTISTHLQALKFNQTLSYLSLGRNPIGDEGASSLGKVLSNFVLLHDEIISRRKALLELEKQRREQEEDPIVKKAKGRIPTSHGRNSSASAKLKSEEMLNKKEPAPAAKKPPAKAGKRENLRRLLRRNRNGHRIMGRGKGLHRLEEEKVEEMREEQEEPNPEINTSVEPMFEHNGQWFVLGNRTLTTLNLSHTDLTELGLKSLLEALQEQEVSSENTPEGLIGLFRLTLQGNAFDKENGNYALLCGLLNARNPFVELESGEKMVERKEEEESEEGNSVLEEES
ncbi:hypothetical protein BC829DRAFT_445476 [Chytridium lagenaria]|nr:hypothetical protein BC829DRAFT_445476 [Chytridium lagenaria]